MFIPPNLVFQTVFHPSQYGCVWKSGGTPPNSNGLSFKKSLLEWRCVGILHFHPSPYLFLFVSIFTRSIPHLVVSLLRLLRAQLQAGLYGGFTWSSVRRSNWQFLGDLLLIHKKTWRCCYQQNRDFSHQRWRFNHPKMVIDWAEMRILASNMMVSWWISWVKNGGMS